MNRKTFALLSSGTLIHAGRIIERCIEYWYRLIDVREFFTTDSTREPFMRAAIVGFRPQEQRVAVQAWRDSLFCRFPSWILRYNGDVQEQNGWMTTTKAVDFFAPNAEAFSVAWQQVTERKQSIGRLVAHLALIGPEFRSRTLAQYAREGAHFSAQDFSSLMERMVELYVQSPVEFDALLAPAIIDLSGDHTLPTNAHRCQVVDRIPKNWTAVQHCLVAPHSLPTIMVEPEIELARFLECNLGIRIRDGLQLDFFLVAPVVGSS